MQWHSYDVGLDWPWTSAAWAHYTERSMSGTLMGDRILGPLVSKWSGHVSSMSM